jgi:ribosome-associated toxin RatA of RatAB toxin-antitoxin module
VEVTIPAAIERVWAVLTDYDRLDDFVPSLEDSRILKRESDHLLLYQRGRIWFPFYRRKPQVVFRVEETPPGLVQFKAIQGEFLIHQGSWMLKVAQGGTEIRYEAVVEPDFWIPQWVLYELERQTMKQTIRAVIRRCLEEELTPGSSP